MQLQHQLQLPIQLQPDGPPPVPAAALPAVLIGTWSSGDRYVRRNGHLELAHVWFELCADGTVTVTLRYSDTDYLLASSGVWRLQGCSLSVSLGGSAIRSSVVVEDDVLRWAGEVMTRSAR